MAYHAPPEELSESDDEFGAGFGYGFTDRIPKGDHDGTTLTVTLSSNNRNKSNQPPASETVGTSTGFRIGATTAPAPAAEFYQQPKSTMGLSKSASSRIPVISPINNGVNVEDFRLAVIRGSTEAAKKYINQGVDVNLTFRTGWTPLMYAAHQVNTSLMEMLLKKGAIADQGSTTALMTCCSANTSRTKDQVACIQMLIDCGANVNAADNYDMTPLMLACKKGHTDAINLLLENGADKNKQEKRGYSAVCWACSENNLDCVKLLVQKGADLSVKTTEGFSLMELATSQNLLSYLRTLPEFSSPAVPPPSNTMTNGFHHPDHPPPLLGPPGEDSVDAALTEPTLTQGPACSAPNGFSSTQFNSDRVETSNGGQGMYNSSSRSSVPSGPGDSVTPGPSRLGDLEIFLHGLELSALIPKFHANDITFDHFLNITDEELHKIGVVSVGSRKLILDSIHDVHKKDWKPTSIPAFDKVKAGKQLSCAEVTAIVANLASHNAYMKSSIEYVRKQITDNPSLLQVDKNGRGIHALRKFLHELEGNTQTQHITCVSLRHTIEEVLDSGKADTPDHITRTTTERSGNRLVFYGTGLLALGAISLSLYCIAKTRPSHLPRIRLPFMR